MIPRDPVLARLAALECPPVDERLSRAIRIEAHRLLARRPLPWPWAAAVTTSVVAYLLWALHFVDALRHSTALLR